MKTVRDSQIVWPHCSECGCRLRIYQIGGHTYARHFEGDPPTYIFDDGDFVLKEPFEDARGCRCTSYYKEVFYDESKRIDRDKLYKGVTVLNYG